MADKTSVQFKGPFFHTDVGREVRTAIGKAVSAVAAEGKTQMRSQLVPGHGYETGAFRKGIRRKKTGFTARVFARDGRIAAWLSGTSKLNARSRFKGLSPKPFEAAAHATDNKAQDIANKIINALTDDLS